MGFFSWETQDTGRSIANVHSSKPTFPVTMTDDKGNRWTEDRYDGYGVFGGKDYYVLLAEMNGLHGDEDTLRGQGLALAFSKTEHKTPNLTEDPEWVWINEKPDNCPHQGYFYYAPEED